ncbi:MAG TPA: FtsX-like permease family protein [Polyangiales bacterium]|nr:FtsX-like permease family protein [Polyangiales bacterium]
MSLLGIAVKNLGRNLFRATLTIFGVIIAMLSFVLLRTVLSAWTMGAEYAAQDRVATRHKITMVMTLPLRYAEDVRAVPGVRDVAFFNWFGGRVPDRDDVFFANMATDPEQFLRVYDEISLPEDQKKAWVQDRQGAVIGAQLARQMKWKVGQKVTLAGTIFPGDWQFTIRGIYTAKRRSIDQSSLYFNWKYLNESADIPESMKDQIGWIATKVESASMAGKVSKAIDALFDSRDIQTLSMSERAMTASFMGMLGSLLTTVDVVSIVILAIMMLILGNTIAMSVRERTQEYGVMRAIGFQPGHLVTLVLGESAAIGIAGGALGLALCYPLIDKLIGPMMEDQFTSFFPYFRLAEADAFIALGVSVLVAVVAAIIPAIQASKLDVVDALRRVG